MLRLRPKILLPTIAIVGVVSFFNFGHCANNETQALLIEAQNKENSFLPYEYG